MTEPFPSLEKGGIGDEIQIDRRTSIDLDELIETEGYVIDASLVGQKGFENLKLTEDGKTVLIPQPSDDPNDPLNWSWRKKHLILIIISMTAFLPDYGSAVGSVTLLSQAKIWNMTEDAVNHSQAGNVFMLGPGGLVVIALSAYFGRLPVLFYFVVLSLLTAIWCAAATTFNSFMAARILNGFFSTVTQGGGLMFIKDMFFFHEHARKINIWAGFIILSPYFGPCFTAFMLTELSWRWGFWLLSIITGLCLALIVLFVDETYYDRKIPFSDRPIPKSRIMRLLGIEQWKTRNQRSNFKDACMRQVKVISKPTVFLTMVYYFFTFAWVVGINTTLSIFVTPLYNFGLKQIGLFYFTPIVAALLGEIAGHWLHDLIAKTYTRRHAGTFKPEARLLAIYISTPFILSGLILLGFCLQRAYHYMLASLGWGLFVFGIMISTTAIASYNLDCYPEGSGESAAWLCVARNMGGFVISYFQVRWAAAQGTEKSFGIQAAICFVVFLVVVGVQIWGKEMRDRSGKLKFKTN